MYEDKCCTFIPNNMSPGGAFAEAMFKLGNLQTEIKENAGRDQHAWDWFDLNLGKWGAILTRIGIVVMICFYCCGSFLGDSTCEVIHC